jgi:glycosyltransferase involved in cell wall biosynthesis
MKSVSILIPTLNAGRVLNTCLESIAAQIYPGNLIEIVIADGGSTDDTLAIATHHGAKVFPNPLKTGEAGKAVALKHATGEIVAFVDSDNILPRTDWLARMVEPFDDAEIVGSEPLEYTWRPTDGFITRYGALMGMNDPFCLFVGNYDRYNTITGRWTEMPVAVQDRGNYLKLTLDGAALPTIGANGFMARRSALSSCSVQDYFFDIDVVYELLQHGHCRFAKVKVGIVHLFSGDLRTFIRKQARRVKDYFYYSRSNRRQYPWKSAPKKGLVKFILYCITIFPLIAQSLIGYRRKPDRAWFFHPFACWMTLLVYAYGTLLSLFNSQPQDRTGWSQ